jgi:alpha-L-fucosidase
MGAWLDVNGAAIYGSTPGPIQGEAGVRSTAKQGVVYLHVFDWPAGGEIRVPAADMGLPKRAYLLADAAQAPLRAFIDRGGNLVVQGLGAAPDAAASVIVLEM